MQNDYTITTCQSATCPNTAHSKENGLPVFPSICEDISTACELPDGTIKKNTPVYLCLPCAYKCGATV